MKKMNMKNAIVVLGSPRKGAIKGTKYLDQAYRLGLKVK